MSKFGESRMRNAMLKGLNRQTISNQIISKSTKVTSTSSDIPGHGVLKPVSSDYVPNYEEGLSQGRLQREPFVEEKIEVSYSTPFNCHRFNKNYTSEKNHTIERRRNYSSFSSFVYWFVTSFAKSKEKLRQTPPKHKHNIKSIGEMQ